LRDAVIEVLDRVRIPSPARRLGDYPHQFSGGQRQRVVAAMAIACTPRLLIADEPTSALDVTIQAQFIHLMRRIQAETGAGVILITHDLGVAATMCARIAVMYAGRIVETGPVRKIYRAAAHPYTQALLGAIPRIGLSQGKRQQRLVSIPGQPPSALNFPKGCRFAARCPKRMAICEETYPPTTDLGDGHTVSCWLAEPR
jgi:oligopeptide/dipeptide ABC transporter ATP-binding protein